MKKHLLALAAGTATLALSTAAFAQTIPGSKTDTSATITIQLTAASTEAYNFQLGDRNNAEITQDSRIGANGNKIGRSQSSQSLTGANVPDLSTQTGSLSFAAGFISGGTGFVQYGNDNKLVANQSNNGNEVFTGGPGTIINNSNYGANGTDLGSFQKGNNNTAHLDQSGTNGVISLQQNGDYNGYNGAGASYDTITQTGTREQAVVRQDGNRNLFTIGQSGTDNYINVKQTNNNPVLDFGNYVKTSQTGTRGSIYATQTRGNDYGADGNRLDATQSSTDAQLTVNQTGNANLVTSKQQGGGQYQYAAVTQDGNSNIADVTQSGSYEYAAIYQKGNGNRATTDQSGQYNIALIYQETDGNTANISQAANGAVGVILQGGMSGNNASITQGYGASNAHALAYQVGSTNVARISQK